MHRRIKQPAIVVVGSMLLLQAGCLDDADGWSNGNGSTLTGPTPLKILTVGANLGNRATQTWVGGVWPGTVVDHVDANSFNSMSKQDLQAYDVVLTQWDTSATLKLGTNSPIHNYVYEGGGLIVDGDHNNFNDLAWLGIGGATSSCPASGRSWELNTWDPGTTLLRNGLGSNPDLENCHGMFPNYNPALLSPFLWDASGNVSGLAGYHNKGKVVITGPDQDYHAHPTNHPEQFQLLLNEISWVSQRHCKDGDSILGAPATEFCTKLQYLGCGGTPVFSDEQAAYAEQLYESYFTGFPATTQELFAGSTDTIHARTVRKYELEYVSDIGVSYTGAALEYLYSGSSMIPIERTATQIRVTNPSKWMKRTLSNEQVFKASQYDAADRWIHQNPKEYLPAVASYHNTLALQLASQVRCKPKVWDAVKACTDCNDLISALSDHDLGRTYEVRLARPPAHGQSYQLSKPVKVLAVDSSESLVEHATQAFEDFGGNGNLTARWRMEISSRLRALATWDPDGGVVGIVFRTAP